MQNVKPSSHTGSEFLDGKPKLLLIDGQLVPSASGRTFDTINPATGKVLAQVAEADAEDVDRAVAAARRAFDEGPWRRFTPFERQAALLRLADLVEKHFDEIAMLDTLDMGSPIASTRARKQRAIALLRYNAGQATAIHGDTIANSQAGEIFSYTLKEPIGVVGAINAWNGPLRHGGVEDCAGVGGRLHNYSQACGAGAIVAAAARRIVPGGWYPHQAWSIS